MAPCTIALLAKMIEEAEPRYDVSSKEQVAHCCESTKQEPVLISEARRKGRDIPQKGFADFCQEGCL